MLAHCFLTNVSVTIILMEEKITKTLRKSDHTKWCSGKNVVIRRGGVDNNDGYCTHCNQQSVTNYHNSSPFCNIEEQRAWQKGIEEQAV